MLVLLSPAKKLDFARPLPAVQPTEPQLAAEMREVLTAARARTRAELADLMDLSEDLATLTHERFRDLPDSGDLTGRPAILAFNGDVYLGLDAPSLTVAELEWAQTRVGILSGLYGFLRPLDRIHPYRLEMGTKLQNPRGKDLYAFWRERLTGVVERAVEGQSDPTVLNLASDEYFSAVDRKRLKARLITPMFQDVKDGKARSLFLFVKRARGAMTRWIVQNRVERSAEVQDAVIDGYRFVPEASDDSRWVFRRPQPPPPG